jgi:hypothetical protein
VKTGGVGGALRRATRSPGRAIESRFRALALVGRRSATIRRKPQFFAVHALSADELNVRPAGTRRVEVPRKLDYADRLHDLIPDLRSIVHKLQLSGPVPTIVPE